MSSAVRLGQWDVTVVSRSGSGIYIETTRNISSIYENRDATTCMVRYQIGVILLTVLVGCVILFMLFFVMRNMQKLSRVTRQFARGQYDARVKIKSEDEIGRLAEDFNWMADAMSRTDGAASVVPGPATGGIYSGLCP